MNQNDSLLPQVSRRKALGLVLAGTALTPLVRAASNPFAEADRVSADLTILKVGSPEYGMPSDACMQRFAEALGRAAETGRIVTGLPLEIGIEDKEVPYSITVLEKFYESRFRDLYIFRLGDPDTGWLPEAEDEQDFVRLLELLEDDPGAALIFHHMLTIDIIPNFFQRRCKVVA